jgi:chromosome segregation ATPase
MSEQQTAGDHLADTRPCAHCGRPVPQRTAAGRPFRYCRDNDGACQGASRNSRMRHRNAPGLAGQVARTWEAVDRLDQVVETLTEALHAELSPVGVERQLAQVRAEAATQVAAAQTERDEARREAEAAGSALTVAQQATAAALADRAAAREEAQQATQAATVAHDRADEALAARDEALRAVSAAEALRTQAESDRDLARRDLRSMRAQAESDRRTIADLTRERDAARDDAHRAATSAVEAIEQADRFRAAAQQAQTRAAQAQAEATEASRDARLAREEAQRADAAAGHARAAVVRAEQDREQVGVELRAVRDATAIAEARLAELVTRLDTAQADRDIAQADRDAATDRAARLSVQVSDLAAALASLSSRAVPAPVAPS